MIYTIGYSNRPLAEFLRELSRRGISCLVDVRSVPWSRNPAFTSSQIERWSDRAGLMYRREGEVLGGRSTVPIGGAKYCAALEGLITAASREQIVLLCAEGEPENCHRCLEIGAALLTLYDAPTTNIRRDGSNENVIRTLMRVPPSKLAHPLLKRLQPLLSAAVLGPRD